jgi:hypothetical protein
MNWFPPGVMTHKNPVVGLILDRGRNHAPVALDRISFCRHDGAPDAAQT